MSELESARYWLFWIERGSSIALLLVAIGVGYEFVANRLERPLRAKIDAAREAQIARLENDTAEANARAEEAHLAQLKIAERLAPRFLRREQQKNLVEELKLIDRCRIELFANVNHDEVVSLRDQIMAALREAGWDARVNLNRRTVAQPINGIVFEIAPGASQEIRGIAIQLLVALRNAGLQASGPAPSYSLVTDASIEIIVGNKP